MKGGGFLDWFLIIQSTHRIVIPFCRYLLQALFQAGSRLFRLNWRRVFNSRDNLGCEKVIGVFETNTFLAPSLHLLLTYTRFFQRKFHIQHQIRKVLLITNDQHVFAFRIIFDFWQTLQRTLFFHKSLLILFRT